MSQPVAVSAPIRVMIVDDSIVARAVLDRALRAEPDFLVAGQASSAAAALDLLEHDRFDLILLDLAMPGVSGLAALPKLLAAGRGARILVVSAEAGRGAAATLEALRLGAVDAVLKPVAGDFAAARFAATLIDRLRRIGRATGTAATPAVAASPAPLPDVAVRMPVECLAIGASTGGVHALAAFLDALPREMTAPILVTQHLPTSFMPYFAGQLREMSGRPTTIAASGAPLTPGAVLLAPGDGHIELAGVGTSIHVRLSRKPAPSGCMPSVDPMLAAVAARYGPGGIGVVLSGMGRDGLAGARALANAGGTVFAQDVASSTVWGMPGAVATAGLAAAVAPPAALATLIARSDAAARHLPRTSRWT